MVEKIKKPYSIKKFLPSIKSDVEDAVDFTLTEFDDDFEKGDRYANGEVDIPHEEGRSSVVYTMVRDTIRAMKPSIMRVLTANRRRLVKYWPSNLKAAAVLEQQTVYVHQLFWANDGYSVLYALVDESLSHRVGPTKTYWLADPTPKFVRLTYLTGPEVEALAEIPDVEILKVTPVALPVGTDSDIPEEAQFFDVEAIQTASNGKIVMEAVPYGEFFISRNATSTDDAAVHGHRRSVTVSEAIEMGLDYDDWFELDNEDPDQAQVQGVQSEKKGYQKYQENDRGDELSHKFLLTEAYVRMDLENEGYEQLYVVWLGGTSYKYLDHERIDETPFDLPRHDPIPFTPWGKSVADITVNTQDVMTSMLRGMVDNVHLANTPRFGGNPSQVNFDDLMDHQFGHPIRFKGTGTSVQVVQVPSQLQATLPMLQWLEQDAQNKVGQTKAAQGLDPSAMQSTDKQAVANTIQLSQGQIELAVRNLIETGIVPIFRKLLKLSIQHLDRVQIIKMRGNFIPVDQMMFDPELYAEPQVGLGAAEDDKRLAGLMFTMQKQQEVYTTMGPANPFVSLSNMYNTLEDLSEEYGLTDVSRYWNIVTPEVEQQFAKQKQAEAQELEKTKKGMDPAAALVEAETVKSGTEKIKAILKAQTDSQNQMLDVLKFNADDDFRRDQMAQDRVIKLADITAKTKVATDGNAIKAEQDQQRQPAVSGPE